MCLVTVYRGKKKKAELAKLPKSGYYWKLALLLNGKYYPPIFSGCPYKKGWNNTRPKSEWAGYLLAFHLFRTKKQARKMKSWVAGIGKKKVIVRCKVKRKDIINIGLQEGYICVVATRFWMPKPT